MSALGSNYCDTSVFVRHFSYLNNSQNTVFKLVLQEIIYICIFKITLYMTQLIYLFADVQKKFWFRGKEHCLFYIKALRIMVMHYYYYFFFFQRLLFLKVFALVESWQKRIKTETCEYIVLCPKPLDFILLDLFTVYCL